MWAIIGGTGFEEFEGFKTLEFQPTATPFGDASSGLRRVSYLGREFIFLPRHGSKHELLPAEVNYRANIFRLKTLGVRRICSISAVGSLRKELSPGDLVLPTQYIDRTKGIRPSSFCGGGLVAHVSLAKPVWEEGVQHLANFPGFDFKVHAYKTYVCIEGPYFSTRAESQSYRELGADIIGMTNFPEFALAREAGIGYLPCCFVTDYDSWDYLAEHVKLEMVIQVMKQNNQKAIQVLKNLLSSDIPSCKEAGRGSIKFSLLRSDVSDSFQRSVLEILG